MTTPKKSDYEDNEFSIRRNQKMTKKKYGIWCRVSGEVTGSRQAWLKEKGKIWTTTNKKIATNRVNKYNKEMNKGRKLTGAKFNFSVAEYE